MQHSTMLPCTTCIAPSALPSVVVRRLHAAHRRQQLMVRAAGSTFGHAFRVTTFGESHGGAVGCVIDGVPPRLPLTKEEIQKELDRRRPGGGWGYIVCVWGLVYHHHHHTITIQQGKAASPHHARKQIHVTSCRACPPMASHWAHQYAWYVLYGNNIATI